MGSDAHLSRRSFGHGLFIALALAGAGAIAAEPRRIVSLDFGLAETLLEIGVVPVGLTATDDWSDWVGEPRLPTGVVNLGGTFEPNVELLLELKPDLILLTPFLAGLSDKLRRIAPVLSLPLYDEAGEPLKRATEAALHLGRITGRAAAAESLIARVDATFARVRERLRPVSDTPVCIVQFMDARHVRVFGAKSLFQDVLDRIGLTNAWTRETNYWGFATVGFEALATTEDIRLLRLAQADDYIRLSQGPLWRSMPFVQRGRVTALPPVLMFGALPSAERFARLVDAQFAPADDGG
ncbi:ABC transporter substrate-binding protein [Bradyrhizobium manausense]|nr:ABC transporter substrate-binding protein [Bradyrhizobium manausense]MBR0834212.1 ABC transporter substrate-binding protein [Bradyrhizobium manausense]